MEMPAPDPKDVLAEIVQAALDENYELGDGWPLDAYVFYTHGHLNCISLHLKVPYL